MRRFFNSKCNYFFGVKELRFIRVGFKSVCLQFAFRQKDQGKDRRPTRMNCDSESQLFQDEYEVRVYDSARGRRLVAAIEIVSPANKDRPDHRRAFVAKYAALLREQLCVVIVDLVTTRHFNLYHDLLELTNQTDPAFGVEPPTIFAVAC